MMTIRDRIKRVIKSKYSNIEIAHQVAISVQRVREFRYLDNLDLMPLGICEKFLHFYNYMHAQKQRAHNERGIASVKDIKDKLRNPWEYAVYYPDGHLKIHRKIQPEVHRLSYQEFVIKTPYYQTKDIQITYILIKRKGVWFLAVYPGMNAIQWLKSLSHKLTKSQIHYIKRYIRYLMSTYQVSELSSGNCYIPIVNRSIQDAYYRLNAFELSYYSVLCYESRQGREKN